VAAQAGSHRVAVPAGGVRLPLTAQRKLTVRQPGASILTDGDPALDQPQLPVPGSQFNRIRDITNMVPV
jgi:hypothetical protein